MPRADTDLSLTRAWERVCATVDCDALPHDEATLRALFFAGAKAALEMGDVWAVRHRDDPHDKAMREALALRLLWSTEIDLQQARAAGVPLM